MSAHKPVIPRIRTVPIEPRPRTQLKTPTTTEARCTQRGQHYFRPAESVVSPQPRGQAESRSEITNPGQRSPTARARKVDPYVVTDPMPTPRRGD